MKPTAIILSGWHPWRRAALEALCPRPLLPVANRPLLEHLLFWLHDGGVRRVVLCVNHRDQRLERYVPPLRDLDLHVYIDQVPRGPAGVLADAASILPGEPIIALDGSVLPTFALTDLLAVHADSLTPATLAVYTGGHDARRGEPVGIYVFDRQTLQVIPETGYQDIKEGLIAQLRTSDRSVRVFPLTERPLRITGVGSYLALQRGVLTSRGPAYFRDEGYESRGAAWVHQSAVVADSARLLGHVMIGPGTQVAADAIIIEPSVIGDCCAVGSEAVISASAVWDRVHIGRRAVLRRAVVPPDTSLADGESGVGPLFSAVALR